MEWKHETHTTGRLAGPPIERHPLRSCALDTHTILARKTSTATRAETEEASFADKVIKLRGERKAGNSNRDLWIVPLTVNGAIIAAIMARLPEILHVPGVGQ